MVIFFILVKSRNFTIILLIWIIFWCRINFLCWSVVFPLGDEYGCSPSDSDGGSSMAASDLGTGMECPVMCLPKLRKNSGHFFWTVLLLASLDSSLAFKPCTFTWCCDLCLHFWWTECAYGWRCVWRFCVWCSVVCVRVSETQVLLPCKIHTRVRASCDLCLHFGELARVRVLERSFARDVFVIWRLIFSPDWVLSVCVHTWVRDSGKQ